MQGTVVLLMALSGLGCHHKSCDVAVYAAPQCYSSSCYVTASAQSSCYSGCYTSSCYSSCYTARPAVTYVPGVSSLCFSSHRWGYTACYNSCFSSCYNAGFATCYTTPSWGPRKHRHGLFGCGRRACGECVTHAAPVAWSCGSVPVFGPYNPAVVDIVVPEKTMPAPASSGVMNAAPAMTDAAAKPEAPKAVDAPKPSDPPKIDPPKADTPPVKPLIDTPAPVVPAPPAARPPGVPATGAAPRNS